MSKLFNLESKQLCIDTRIDGLEKDCIELFKDIINNVQEDIIDLSDMSVCITVKFNDTEDAAFIHICTVEKNGDAIEIYGNDYQEGSELPVLHPEDINPVELNYLSGSIIQFIKDGQITLK